MALDSLMVPDEGAVDCRTIEGAGNRFPSAVGKCDEILVPFADKSYLFCCPRRCTNRASTLLSDDFNIHVKYQLGAYLCGTNAAYPHPTLSGDQISHSCASSSRSMPTKYL